MNRSGSIRDAGLALVALGVGAAQAPLPDPGMAVEPRTTAVVVTHGAGEGRDRAIRRGGRFPSVSPHRQVTGVWAERKEPIS